MRLKNDLDERTTIEIQIATYREIARLATDRESLEYIEGRITQLQQKLRQMDN